MTELIIMLSAYTLTGARNNEVSAQLGNWARRTGVHRMAVADRSPAFARCCVDFQTADQGLDPTAFSRYWPVCPNLVIELQRLLDSGRGTGGRIRFGARAGLGSAARLVMLPFWLVN